MNYQMGLHQQSCRGIFVTYLDILSWDERSHTLELPSSHHCLQKVSVKIGMYLKWNDLNKLEEKNFRK